MAAYITTDGFTHRISDVSPQGRYFTMGELQRLVGGYFEVIYADGLYLVVDEDGKSKRKPVNHYATMAVKDFLPRGEQIVGDALLCSATELDYTE